MESPVCGSPAKYEPSGISDGCAALRDIRERADLITGHGKEVRNLERRMAELAATDTAESKEHGRKHRADPERH